MNNVAFHKSIQIRNYIEEQEFEVDFLPPYSPFLNPCSASGKSTRKE